MSEPIIKFENVSKRYRIGSGQGSLRDVLAALPRRLFGRDGLSPDDPNALWALRGISFEVRRGETLGIIGPNGAGKTTILKLLSNITQPTEGRIEVKGRVGSLIELGAGFHPDLTGRENVYLCGAVLGLSRRELDVKFEEIVAFAELEKFMDTPVKRYSSGMYARLGFSVAAHVNPDILLVDEVLAVGDMAFQSKCLKRMQSLREAGVTVLFVSHNLYNITALCDRTILLRDGRIVFDGESLEAVDLYKTSVLTQVSDQTRHRDGEISCLRHGSFEAEIKTVKLLDKIGNETEHFETGQPMRIQIHFVAHKRIPQPVFGVAIKTMDEVYCCGVHTKMDGFTIDEIYGPGVIEIEFESLGLMPNRYLLSASILESQGIAFYDYHHHHLYSFTVTGAKWGDGIFYLEHKWRRVK